MKEEIRLRHKGKHFVRYCNKRNYTDNDYSIVRAVLGHMDDLLSLSLEQLAEESHLSEASVSRVIRRSGFDSFWDFKSHMAKFLSARRLQKTQEYLDTRRGMDDDAVGERLYQTAVGNLEATRRGLDTAKLARIVKRMDQSRAVYLVGDTRDLYCFYSLQMDLMCRGKTVYFCNIDEVTADLLSDLDSRSVLCVFSVCSEYYQDARRLVFREARQKNAAVVWFTQDQQEADRAEDAAPEVVYEYGVPGSQNEGYYSLPLLAQMMSELLYKTDKK